MPEPTRAAGSSPKFVLSSYSWIHDIINIRVDPFASAAYQSEVYFCQPDAKPNFVPMCDSARRDWAEAPKWSGRFKSMHLQPHWSNPASKCIRELEAPDDRAHESDQRHIIRPFSLSGIDEVQAAGTYTVQTHEEPLPGLSFLAWRRIATLIFLPSRPGGAFVEQVIDIDPLELVAAQERDAASA